MFCVLNEAVNLTLIMHAPRRPSLTERVESALQKLNEAKELRVWLNLDTVVALCPSLSEEDFKGRGGYMTVTSGRSDLERGFHTHVLKRKLAHVHIFDRAKALDAGVCQSLVSGSNAGLNSRAYTFETTQKTFEAKCLHTGKNG